MNERKKNKEKGRTKQLIKMIKVENKRQKE